MLEGMKQDDHALLWIVCTCSLKPHAVMGDFQKWLDLECVAL